MSSVKAEDKWCKARSMRQMDGEMAKSCHETGDRRRKFWSNQGGQLEAARGRKWTAGEPVEWRTDGKRGHEARDAC